MSCISSYSGHFSDLYFLIVRTQLFFPSFGICMAFNQCVCLSFRRARQLTKISAEQDSATVSVANVHPALMHSLINARFN